jgi:hypothetical protein
VLGDEIAGQLIIGVEGADWPKQAPFHVGQEETAKTMKLAT